LSDTAVRPDPVASRVDPRRDRYKWIAVINTSIGMFMAILDRAIS
jgi:hypothetical protein